MTRSTEETHAVISKVALPCCARDAKLYGNMISKLSKLEDTEDNGQMSQTVNKKRGLLWPLSEMVRRFFTADGSKGFTLWPALRLLIPDEWRTGLKALRADSISKLKKAFPELVQEVILSPQILSYVQVSHAYQRFNLWSEELPSNRYIMIYCHLVTVSRPSNFQDFYIYAFRYCLIEEVEMYRNTSCL
ncbi:Defective in cullin neddylation protein [Zea mays]|uniref:Defective in cullin neddylation protein n=1 Tax=Zea mays TaxID=4577 RepID=A0A1D6GLZ1_MAIZE|nr:Defective in cullin neddylation protein [Zea mays]